MPPDVAVGKGLFSSIPPGIGVTVGMVGLVGWTVKVAVICGASAVAGMPVPDGMDSWELQAATPMIRIKHQTAHRRKPAILIAPSDVLRNKLYPEKMVPLPFSIPQKICSFGYRDGEIECGAFAKLALEPDFTALHLDQAAGDIQSQPRARRFARLGILGTEKLLEYPRLILG